MSARYVLHHHLEASGILTYGEIQVRQVDDVMTLYMAFTIYAAYKAGMAVQAKRQKQTKEKIATTSDKQKGE